jgi:hypothetical protein
MYIPQSAPIWYQQCVRPRERVPPPPVQIVDLIVDFGYPVKSGIQKAQRRQLRHLAGRSISIGEPRIRWMDQPSGSVESCCRAIGHPTNRNGSNNNRPARSAQTIAISFLIIASWH